jgi:hypothetical protein
MFRFSAAGKDTNSVLSSSYSHAFLLFHLATPEPAKNAVSSYLCL